MSSRLLVALVAAALTVTACSSSSSSSTGSSVGGSTKAKSCKNSKLNHSASTTDSACNECGDAKCSAEGAAVLGSDPNAFGGPCGETITCLCDCDSSDTKCLASCPSAPKACTDALAAAQSCESAKCATECGADGG